MEGLTAAASRVLEQQGSLGSRGSPSSFGGLQPAAEHNADPLGGRGDNFQNQIALALAQNPDLQTDAWANQVVQPQGGGSWDGADQQWGGASAASLRVPF